MRMNRRALKIALGVVILAAACEPAPTSSPFDAQEFAAPDGGAADLPSQRTATNGGFEGTWAQATDWSTCVTVGSRIETRSRKLLRVNITRKGNRLLETRQLCQIQLTPIFGLKTVVPQAVVDSMEPWQVESRLLGEGSESVAYAGGIEAQLMGLKLVNPIYDPLPSPNNPGDPRLLDPEKDGHPGATFMVGPSCKLYVAQREVSALSGTLGANGHIEGGGVHGTEQVVFGSSAAACGQSFATFSNTDHHRFVMVSTAGRGWDDDGDGDISCAEIVTHHLEWMSWAEPDNNRCPEGP